MANKRKATEPPKNPKKLKVPKKDPATLEEKEVDDNDDNEEDDDGDLKKLMEGAKPTRRRVTASVYSIVVETGQYVTTGEHRESRLLACKARVEQQEAETAPVETEEEAATEANGK